MPEKFNLVTAVQAAQNNESMANRIHLQQRWWLGPIEFPFTNLDPLLV